MANELDDVLHRFNLVNENQILEFISKIGDKLVSLLDSTYYLVRKYFPIEDLNLEFVPDYEEPVLNTLVIYIGAIGNEAYEKMLKVYDDWDLRSQDEDVCGKLMINLI